MSANIHLLQYFMIFTHKVLVKLWQMNLLLVYPLFSFRLLVLFSMYGPGVDCAEMLFAPKVFASIQL